MTKLDDLITYLDQERSTLDTKRNALQVELRELQATPIGGVALTWESDGLPVTIRAGLDALRDEQRKSETTLADQRKAEESIRSEFGTVAKPGVDDTSMRLKDNLRAQRVTVSELAKIVAEVTSASKRVAWLTADLATTTEQAAAIGDEVKHWRAQKTRRDAAQPTQSQVGALSDLDAKLTELRTNLVGHFDGNGLTNDVLGVFAARADSALRVCEIQRSSMEQRLRLTAEDENVASDVREQAVRAVAESATGALAGWFASGRQALDDTAQLAAKIFRPPAVGGVRPPESLKLVSAKQLPALSAAVAALAAVPDAKTKDKAIGEAAVALAIAQKVLDEAQAVIDLGADPLATLDAATTQAVIDAKTGLDGAVANGSAGSSLIADVVDSMPSGLLDAVEFYAKTKALASRRGTVMPVWGKTSAQWGDLGEADVVIGKYLEARKRSEAIAVLRRRHSATLAKPMAAQENPAATSATMSATIRGQR